MAIRYIQYSQEQKRGMAISSYSLYVNGSYLCNYPNARDATNEAQRYAAANDVEIYPALKRRY